LSNIQDIPDVLQKTLDGKKFLLFDSGVSNLDRFIIFSSENSLNILKDATIWQSDGTLKARPNDFYQFYTVFAHVFGTNLPLVYILLSGKNNRFVFQCSSKAKRVGLQS
jgi:hypothetical protein